MSAASLRAMSSRIEQSDYVRRSPASAGGRAGHKEWTHFCVLGDPVDLLVNLSLMDEPARGGAPCAEKARVTILARDAARGAWEGDVDGIAPGDTRVTGGRVGLTLGPSQLRFRDGRYELDAELASGAVRARLRFEPRVMPALTSSIDLGGGGSMRWLVVPRLLASGEIEVAGRRRSVHGAPAYHDHDWGLFSWGDDFTWEWAAILPREPSVPWSLVYMRISDRGRLRTLSQGLLLWRQDAPWRIFRADDVAIDSLGFLRPGRTLRVPRVMGLAAPATASDLPARLEVRAAAGNDSLELSLELLDCAQIAIPNQVGDRGTSLLSETRAHARVGGRVRGETVAFEGPALAEFNHDAV